MSNLIPEQRVNKNGVAVIKHVRPMSAALSVKAIPPVSHPAQRTKDFYEVRQQMGTENPQAVDTLRRLEPASIAYVSDALRTNSNFQVVDMFNDLCLPPEGTIDPKSAAAFADMCFFVANDDIEDMYTAELALGLLHTVREKAGGDKDECFYRSSEKLRDDIGTVLGAVRGSRFIAGVVDNWNNGTNDGAGDHDRALELMTALYDRASTNGNVDREVEVFRELHAQGFADFYDDTSDAIEKRESIPSYINLVDSVIAVGEKTRLSDETLIEMMEARGMRDGNELTKFIDEFKGSPVLIDGAL